MRRGPSERTVPYEKKEKALERKTKRGGTALMRSEREKGALTTRRKGRRRRELRETKCRVHIARNEI